MSIINGLTGLLVAFAAFGVSGMPMIAHAQNYPNRSISVIVPFPAGGPSDVVARIVTEHMGRTLGQQLVIENVAGAGGTLGSARVATAQPDGYTLLAGSMGSHVAAPVLTPNIKYDSERDFEPIGLTAHSPAVIVARKDFPAKNPSEFVVYLKQNAEKTKAGPRRHWCLFAYGLPAIQSGLGHQADVRGISRYWSSDE